MRQEIPYREYLRRKDQRVRNACLLTLAVIIAIVVAWQYGRIVSERRMQEYHEQERKRWTITRNELLEK